MTLYEQAAPAVKFEFKAIGALKAMKDADGKMRLRGVASSTTRDLHGDVMTESALQDMENSANKNLTIFLNHSYSVPEDVGGSVERATRSTRDVDHSGNPNVDLDLDIVMDETNPRAVQTWNSIKSGTKLGLSIGANLPEGGYKRNKDGTYIIEHCELLETSIVGVPANPRSWVEYAVKALNDARKDAPNTVHLANGDEAILLGSTCPSCGGSKSSPKESCGSDYHKAEEPAVEKTEPVVAAEPVVPEVADATVHIDIDTGSPDAGSASAPTSQEAQASAPGAEAVAEEVADGEDALVGDTVTREVTPALVDGQFTYPAAKMTELVDGYAKTVQELMTLRLAHTELQTAKVAVEKERDQAIADRDRVLTETTALLARLADVPLVRKTAVATAYGEFREKFGGVYDEGFLRMLENTKHD